MSWTPQYPRVIPERRPPGHAPRAPRWTLTFDQPVSLVTSDYLAIQAKNEDSAEIKHFASLAGAATVGDAAPEAHELLSFTDSAGMFNLVHLGYWKDAGDHATWLASSALATWFAGLDPARIGHGAWHEVIQVPADRLETICAKPDWRFGLARCPGTQLALTSRNGYFGAARDRLPASAIDRLEAAASHSRRARPVQSRGRRVRAECGHNTVVIRSGQHWETADGEQLRDYVEELQPKLLAGMEHLRSHADSEGTMSLRVMTSLDPETLTPRRETSVLAHFNSLEPLEQWSATHSTHAAIYEHAIAKQRQYGEDRSIITWHEVFILPRSAAFEYVNCHAETGILPFAQTVLEVDQERP